MQSVTRLSPSKYSHTIYLKWPRLPLLLFTILFVSGCAIFSGHSLFGKSEKELVKAFLHDMKNGNEKELHSYISPEFQRVKHIDIAQYRVNTYLPLGYQIERYSSKSGIVTATIWGGEKEWVHRLSFRVVKEDGQLYLYPSGVNYETGFVQPWFSEELFIIDKKE